MIADQLFDFLAAIPYLVHFSIPFIVASYCTVSIDNPEEVVIYLFISTSGSLDRSISLPLYFKFCAPQLLHGMLTVLYLMNTMTLNTPLLLKVDSMDWIRYLVAAYCMVCTLILHYRSVRGLLLYYSTIRGGGAGGYVCITCV